ncbi:DUF5954 family protein [Streptomyces sp. B1866]|uniref:DUF5954 family protein n=1 Tax=Streptomyces sp. B1866 TaxID=3075431 RepID=UPI002890FEAC|nr:DUF5954 family protein [Streptomyces sp. B1866]MDT3395908.1 DUF5954 family protein [Streptomyces sp. B1866]
MVQEGDDVPAYRTIKVTALESPVAALADVEAWRAREAYPRTWFAGGPCFGTAREREEGGWELLPYFSSLTPQQARDNLDPYFRGLAQKARESGDESGAAECERAAEQIDWEPVNELTVLGARYRVVRAEPYVRMGPDGPEPPRSTDPDPARPGGAQRVPEPAAGFVIDPFTATGMSEGILRLELLGGVRKRGTVPPEVYEDALRAADTHPGGVLLPATFMTAEKKSGAWRPYSTAIATTPQAARDALTLYLRVLAPCWLRLGPEERAAYVRAADRLDEERGHEVAVAGRYFRVARVERLVRIGPDGPEGPRPSDHDPTPPFKRLGLPESERGLVRVGDDDDDDPEGLCEDDAEESEESKELTRLLLAEVRRRQAMDP